MEELVTARVLGAENARLTAMQLMHDIDYSLKQKVLNQFEYLRRSARHQAEFEKFVGMDTTERIGELAKGDMQTAREVIMAEGLRLYLERLAKEGDEQRGMGREGEGMA